MDVVDGKTQVTNGDLYSTKPGTLAGRYLRRFWQPLGRSQDVHVGRAYTTKSRLFDSFASKALTRLSPPPFASLSPLQLCWRG